MNLLYKKNATPHHVHEDCRKEYCYAYNRKRKQEDANDETVRSPKTRAGIETFDFQASIKALCEKRNDDWARQKGNSIDWTIHSANSNTKEFNLSATARVRGDGTSYVWIKDDG
ncbi:hypothetical protein DPMN_187270 [Dreissena polymorpha]|uniref:Uncharacterized protein n=1 Tax=Dreissena polymorpha TaxID=45954 RepID=A0A9D4I8X1_DREPO|nr:hypothetical protein DPMN_187270 [Dreissena polymorpha]